MITNRLYVTESANLIRLLVAAGVPHEARILYDGVQVLYPNLSRSVGDVVCHTFSYGGKNGLLEIMGVGVSEEAGYIVEGYLTAETVFDRWYAHYQAQKKG
jgi:hypothetical protein